MSPLRVFVAQPRSRRSIVDVVGIARVVIDPVQDFLQIEPGVGVGRKTLEWESRAIALGVRSARIPRRDGDSA